MEFTSEVVLLAGSHELCDEVSEQLDLLWLLLWSSWVTRDIDVWLDDWARLEVSISAGPVVVDSTEVVPWAPVSLSIFENSNEDQEEVCAVEVSEWVGVLDLGEVAVKFLKRAG